MKNEALYAKPPSQNRPLNNGVAVVSEDLGDAALKTLRYELETFVCDGEYALGLEKILKSFLGHLDRPEQPGIWVSGFYGSGKSHLVKVLRALWVDFTFPGDGATARGLVKLPTRVGDLLHELGTAAKRASGAHAASGTLGSAAGDSVRLALLQIVFASVGLSQQFHLAQFELWLRQRGVAQQVRAAIEAQGLSWYKELGLLFVSSKMHQAIYDALPDLGPNPAEVAKALRVQFPQKSDISNQELVDAIHDALTVTTAGTRPFPLTLVALDEIQQYVGQNQARSYGVQEVAETCSKRFGGKLLFVGTGQMALAGTPNLQRLIGRFPVTIELSDTDVETVIRKVILAKKPEVQKSLGAVLEENLGEISRHLQGTRLAFRNDDRATLTADYPLLPVRNRLWEKLLRAVDQTGTTAQLRNQVSIVLEAVIATADAPLGTVVPGDFLFDQIAVKLLQSGALPREVHDAIKSLQKAHRDASGSESPDGADALLKSRLLALIYLIGKLDQQGGSDLGVRANSETLADLLVDFLPDGSTTLRKRIPSLLDKLEADGHIMRLDQDYRLQTRESGAWNDEYKVHLGQLEGDPNRVEHLRVDRLREAVATALRPLTHTGLRQGISAVSRHATLHSGASRPPSLDRELTVWVRDGWEEDEALIEAEARQAGSQSPAVFVVIRRHASDELRRLLAAHQAAVATLGVRDSVQGPEADVAREAMDTRRSRADERLRVLVAEVLSGARVFQAGGQEIAEGDLVTKVRAALEHAMVRLYPKFDLADQTGWDKVMDRAKKGSEAALEAIGHKGDSDKHAVTSALLTAIGNGKKGSDLRLFFEASPYGWSQDAIDGGLYALLATGQVRATDADGVTVEAKHLDRKKIPHTSFRTESVTLTAAQRIQIRKVFQSVGVPCNPNEELANLPALVARMKTLMAQAGGDGPRPAPPDAAPIRELESQFGNAQLLRVYTHRDELIELAKTWRETGAEIEARFGKWTLLTRLLDAAGSLGDEVRPQAEAIRTQRLLLTDPDPVPGLVDALTHSLRAALIEAHARQEAEWQRGEERLDSDANWQQLAPEERHRLRQKHKIFPTPEIKTGTADEVLASLAQHPLGSWGDRTAALPTRYSAVLADAAEQLMPDAVAVKLVRGTLKTQAELDTWLDATRAKLEQALAQSGGAGVVLQ